MQEEMIHDIETTQPGFIILWMPHVVVSTARFGPENFKLVEFLPDQLHPGGHIRRNFANGNNKCLGRGCGETLWRSSGSALEVYQRITNAPIPRPNPGATE